MYLSGAEGIVSIKPSRHAAVTDIRAIKYTADDGPILVKLRFTDDWAPIELRKKSTSKQEPSQLLHGRKKITESKLKHLQELLDIVPQDYHGFYRSLNI